MKLFLFHDLPSVNEIVQLKLLLKTKKNTRNYTIFCYSKHSANAFFLEYGFKVSLNRVEVDNTIRGDHRSSAKLFSVIIDLIRLSRFVQCKILL